MIQSHFMNDSATAVSSTQIMTQSPVTLNSTLTSFVSPENVRPFPKAQQRKEISKGRPKCKSKIITATLKKLDIQLQNRMTPKETKKRGKDFEENSDPLTKKLK
ncbi:hypothetical protein AVEN_31297-1 [Araneus ventricosus]|uniref:Uncharacterized protein n=1 Tax=Araneus ventricosus TaxID=182803 RepID=A0A4Y2GC79_ARAVE|nr:hypothetical protein AVEN_31297-1 [Araneus ventricosus]